MSIILAFVVAAVALVIAPALIFLATVVSGSVLAICALLVIAAGLAGAAILARIFVERSTLGRALRAAGAVR